MGQVRDEAKAGVRSAIVAPVLSSVVVSTPQEHGQGGPDDGVKAPVSIRQVAAAAGVSIATVSRVMNNPGAVSSATAAKVQEVIRKLGYQPSPLAQAFSSGSSKVLGLALPSFHGEFYSELMKGADAEAAKHGYSMLVTSIEAQADLYRRNRIFNSGLIDGVAMLAADKSDSLVGEAIDSQLPTVALDIDLTEHGLDSVVLDNDKGAREAVEHLLRWVEPSRCFFVGGPRTNFDTTARGGAFSATLAAHGWTVTPDQITYGEYSFEWGKEWAVRMIKRQGLENAGVLASNDEIASGVLRAAEDARLWVPDQLRLVGFDNSRLAQVVRPRLSSVALPMAEVGAAAVNLLIKRLENKHAPAQLIRLPTRLVVRESSTAMTF